MTRVRLTLAYVGTGFAGWQVQGNAPTVQGCLEHALARICNLPVRVHASGRTDSGVHALGQVAHFDPPPERGHIPWRRALNAILPGDVAVVAAQTAPPDFHARFSASSKEYSYTLWTEPGYVLPQRRPFVWPVSGIDLDAMQEAADHLMGLHDFAAFQNVGTPVKSTVRELTRAHVTDAGLEKVWHFRADGFLKQMVRNIMGCLVEVGRGSPPPDRTPELLAIRNRSLLPATAPPQGLCLEKVTY